MEQFRQIGEVLGSLKALMVFRDNIQINQRQCCLLVDIFSFAYKSIAEEMRQNLLFEEKHTKWKALEQPLRELYKIFKEGESYIRQCLETKDWWAKAISLYQNSDCVEFHIHNLLCCIPVVIEAIESAGETSGWDQDETQRKRLVNSNKYNKEYGELKLFEWQFGKQYLITQGFCNRFDTVWKEDRWILLNKIQEKKISGSTKYENQLIDLLFKNIVGLEPLNGKLLPSSILVGSKDYQVRRRLGGGNQYKEVLWLGESFAIRHFFGDIKSLLPDISLLLSLSHPNILHILCGFTDEEKKEYFLVMELMSRDLSSYIKEICGPRKRVPFSLPVAVDLMLQVARGMGYLHSKKIYHGDLNTSNILVRGRGSSTEGYLHAKISGFGLSSVKNSSQKGASLSFIWYAPEVLEEQEQTGSTKNYKYTEKSDVYSFGMVCFEILTGKVPFDDGHLQGDNMSRNIRAGGRPLFALNLPKYVTNLIKRCWHTDPTQRPSFFSICRILRYIKRFLILNPEYDGVPDPPLPQVDYCDIESGFLRKFPSWGSSGPSPVSQIPFQMFVYRVMEKEKISGSSKDSSESRTDGASSSWDEHVITTMDDPFPSTPERKSADSASPDSMHKRLSSSKKSSDVKASKQPGTPKKRSTRLPQMTHCRQSMRMTSESPFMMMSPRIRRTSSVPSSVSQLS
ncbi:Protein kinase [Quillaja saponaria]|uniref:Protein kinase n=1 Tax=Quillaja saponaria TaxID=32244 RepID=A0AAD7PD76_QUISA|nr:Protein kinase [Quillaja saponaria]